MPPFISICIPAYKNVEFLKRLLDSIAVQTFKNHEVIITDDSPGAEVEQLSKSYATAFPLRYYKNTPPHGMPANWNAAIEKAQGEWIKIMHDDDWFASPDALQQFANAAANNHNKFIFSGYQNIYFDQDRKTKQMAFPLSRKQKILQEPMLLKAENIIGPPSVCMVHKSVKTLYDVRLRWRVDIDYYINILEKEKDFTFIPQHLINVGINKDQVTKYTQNFPEVELPEAFILMKKYGIQPLNNIFVYDAWWRMFRNMKIFSEQKLREYVNKDWDKAILKIIHHLSFTPKPFLKYGVLSKSCMFLSYLANKERNRKH